MNELIKAINKEFGEGRTTGAVFFHIDPATGAKTASPLFMLDDIKAEQPGGSIKYMIERLREWSNALKYMSDDMFTRTLNKN